MSRCSHVLLLAVFLMSRYLGLHDTGLSLVHRYSVYYHDTNFSGSGVLWIKDVMELRNRLRYNSFRQSQNATSCDRF